MEYKNFDKDSFFFIFSIVISVVMFVCTWYSLNAYGDSIAYIYAGIVAGGLIKIAQIITYDPNTKN